MSAAFDPGRFRAQYIAAAKADPHTFLLLASTRLDYTFQEGKEEVFTETDARQFAHHWVLAWNSHDLKAILSHYASDVVLTSPVAARLLGNPSVTVSGKDELGRYFERALEAYPDLRFELLDVMWGLSSVVLYYVNQKGTKTGEFMEFDAAGKVVRVVANYNG